MRNFTVGEKSEKCIIIITLAHNEIYHQIINNLTIRIKIVHQAAKVAYTKVDS